MFNFPDSPTNGQTFTPAGGPIYKYDAAAGVWKAQFPDAGAVQGIPDAPSDGNQYARQNASWVSLSGGAVDATPPGTVIMSARTTPPSGYLACDGASLLRASFPALFSAIGTTYGAADGTHFNVPDMRGEFPRGFDNGRGVDNGRVQGTPQGDGLKTHTHAATSDTAPTHTHGGVTGIQSANHTHTFSDSATTNSAGAHTHTIPANGTYAVNLGTTNFVVDSASGNTGSAGAHTHTVSVSGTTSANSVNHTHTISADGAWTPSLTVANNAGGTSENRPRNVALLFCIKT